MTRSSWGLDTARELNWRLLAACGPQNADWFFVTNPNGGHLTALNRLALELCAGCPVRAECLADARATRVPRQIRIAGGEVIHDGSRATKAPRAAGPAVRNHVHAARHDRRWKP